MIWKRVPSDVIKAVFHYMGPGIRFASDVPRIHTEFYEISKESEFASLFKDFIFDTARAFPYSQTVRFALDRLQKAELLECINPSLNRFMISEKLAASGDIEQLFNLGEQAILKNIAERFKRDVAEDA